MKHKKEVFYLEDPSPDPFLAPEVEADLLRKYAYLENEDYKRYRRQERIHLILIGLVCLFLAGLLYLLLTVPAEKIDNFLI